MVGVTAILGGYLASQFWPDTFSGTYNSPLFMWLFCIVFSLGVGYIAYRGVNGTTAVNMAINIIQITALVVFAIMAIAYRVEPSGRLAWAGTCPTARRSIIRWRQVNVTDDKGKPVQDTWADNTPKTDDKSQPVYKQQDRQVTKDDLDKTKNTNAVELAGLTALGLGEGDPYPVLEETTRARWFWTRMARRPPMPFIVSYKPEDAVTGKPGTRRTRRRSTSTPAPDRSSRRMDSASSSSRRASRFCCWSVSNP